MAVLDGEMVVLVAVLDGEIDSYGRRDCGAGGSSGRGDRWSSSSAQHTHTYNTVLGDQEIMFLASWNRSHTEVLDSFLRSKIAHTMKRSHTEVLTANF